MYLRFLGYGDNNPFFGDGNFTIGRYYEMVSGPVIYCALSPDAGFIDSDGENHVEELDYFSDDS
jgi:hypothetical protein